MGLNTIAVMSPGDMGHAVGRVLGEGGYRIITCLSGRSARSRMLAENGGLEDVGDLPELLKQADLVLSIMRPASALGFARQAAAAARATGACPFYADCNAVSPATTRRIQAVLEDLPFIDGGIIGPAPGKANPPRFWVSGEHAPVMDELDGKGIVIKQLGPGIGRASQIKMCYAALNKGTLALSTAVLMAAERTGLGTELEWELEHSQQSILKKMRAVVPWLATDAERWSGEMDEIAASFEAVGVTPHFHQGAGDVYRLLATTVLGDERRENIDENRTLEDAVRTFAAAIKTDQTAE